MGKFLAHICDAREQSVYEHLKGTSKLCAEFADSFGCREQGALIGFAHDIGKYSFDFQHRLYGGNKVDHSTAGAYECYKLGQIPASFCIAGHHGGLPNGGTRGDAEGATLVARMSKAAHNAIPDYSPWSDEITLSHPCIPNYCRNNPNATFFTRMLFSCLVDADYKDTERFMTGKAVDSSSANIEQLNNLLDSYISPWFPPKSKLNSKRCEILGSCLAQGKNNGRGLYTLTVPTGGGKTIASLAFALRNALCNGMDRIIYVVPYTSIIEQTADIFREVLGNENVLEHHSGVIFDLGEGSSSDDIIKARSTEDWGVPVVVTTAVQFFESLYSNRPSKCRKLHNIANSVVIFDEAQMLPVPYLKPCVFAISQLVSHYKVSAVLCTATQPALNSIFKEYLPDVSIKELCSDALFEDSVFKRVSFRRAGNLSFGELCSELNGTSQVLCVVNSRKTAQAVFAGLECKGAYHLSTLMCPAHRKQVLAEIRQRLTGGEVCRVVSTSLIEAGVDVDFPLVYREEAGLDSVLQAAGRCNREGKRPAADSVVTVFRSEEKTPPIFSIPVVSGRVAMAAYSDFASKDAVSCYFNELLSLKGSAALDKSHIMRLLDEGTFPFKTVSERFKLIDSDTRTIYIPIDKGKVLVNRLINGECSRALYRELGQYSVSVFEDHFLRLANVGVLQLFDDGSAVLNDIDLYSAETGLSLEADTGSALFI